MDDALPASAACGWSPASRSAASSQHRQRHSIGAQSTLGLWRASCSTDALNADGPAAGSGAAVAGSSQRTRGVSAKTPRPARALVVFDAVRRALRERMRITSDDAQHDFAASSECNTMRRRLSTGLLLSRIIPPSHRNECDHLQSMLTKVEELLERYIVQDQMREASRKMAEAFAAATGANKKSSIANLQKNYKELSKEMCTVEAQMDVALGQVHCKIAGVSGFSRILPGDVFEAVIRIGGQKWKTRGRVLKDGSQKWSKDQHTFDIRSSYYMKVKVFECKMLGRVLLGESRCDVIGLVSAIPQVLAIDASTAGTIKLNVAAEWDPLAHLEDWSAGAEIRRQRLHLPVSHTLSSVSANSTNVLKGAVNWKHGVQGASHLCATLDTSDATSAHPVQTDDDPERQWPRSVADAVVAVQQCLQEAAHLSPSPALQRLSDLLLPSLGSAAEAWRSGTHGCAVCWQKACPLCGKRPVDEGSCDTTNVDDGYNGLESPKRCADHEAVHNESHFGGGGLSYHVGASCDSVEAESIRSAATSATGDSGVHSVCGFRSPPPLLLLLQGPSQRPHVDGGGGCQGGGTLLRGGTAPGYTELEVLAIQHLGCCKQLIQRLQSRGILQAEREKWTSKLVQQTRLLECLHCLSMHGGLLRPDGSIDFNKVLDEMQATQPLREFWSRTARPGKLYLTRDQFMRSLEKMHVAGIGDASEMRISRTCSLMASHVISSALFPTEVRPRLVLMLTQLVDFMTEKGYYSLHDFAADVAAELWLLDSLKSGNSVIITRAIHSLQDTVPADEVVRLLLGHLASPHVDESSSAAAAAYFEYAGRSETSRGLLAAVVSSSMMDPRTDVRTGACLALEKLQCQEAYEKLLSLSETDVSNKVKASAKRTASMLRSSEFEFGLP